MSTQEPNKTVPPRPVLRKRKSEKVTINYRIAEFLRRFRIWIFFIFGIGILVLLGIVVGTAITTGSKTSATKMADKIEASYQSWQTESDTDKKSEISKNISSSVAELVKKYPGQFVTQEARTYKAEVLESEKNWKSAEDEWKTIADHTSKTYLEPIALLRAARDAEEQAAFDRAYLYYEDIASNSSDFAEGYSQTLFSLGRLSEKKQDWANAAKWYNKLVDSKETSDWSSLAKDRLIYMKANNLTK